MNHFKFCVETMPKWFINKVRTNRVILMNFGHNEKNDEEAYCIIDNGNELLKVRHGDNIVKRKDGTLGMFVRDEEDYKKTEGKL